MNWGDIGGSIRVVGKSIEWNQGNGLGGGNGRAWGRSK